MAFDGPYDLLPSQQPTSTADAPGFANTNHQQDSSFADDGYMPMSPGATGITQPQMSVIYAKPQKQKASSIQDSANKPLETDVGKMKQSDAEGWEDNITYVSYNNSS